MHIDVIDLREFYARPLGAVVRRLIALRVRSRWRNLSGMSVFGLGYATPYLTAFRGEALRLGALAPAAQGVMTWPDDGPMQTALVDETGLPLPDSSVDRMLVVHSLETCEASRAMLRDLWRVMAPGGRLLVIVPNRRSIWSRLDTTPFGYGRPYSRGQLARLLRDALFTPVDWIHALHMPPFSWPVLLRWSTAWERLGAVLWPAFSGVIIVEATKQVYAAAPDRGLKKARGRLQPVPAGAVAARAVSGTAKRRLARRSGSA
ncbi:MAG: class I SAM-dependent methyltransferase [Hyphomicrobiales bacterium]|nr:class I SAM-dependent methyltransferase [Hyphomicrobiales bacterium]